MFDFSPAGNQTSFFLKQKQHFWVFLYLKKRLPFLERRLMFVSFLLFFILFLSFFGWGFCFPSVPFQNLPCAMLKCKCWNEEFEIVGILFFESKPNLVFSVKDCFKKSYCCTVVYALLPTTTKNCAKLWTSDCIVYIFTSLSTLGCECFLQLCLLVWLETFQLLSTNHPPLKAPVTHDENDIVHLYNLPKVLWTWLKVCQIYLPHFMDSPCGLKLIKGKKKRKKNLKKKMKK